VKLSEVRWGEVNELHGLSEVKWSVGKWSGVKWSEVNELHGLSAMKWSVGKRSKVKLSSDYVGVAKCNEGKAMVKCQCKMSWQNAFNNCNCLVSNMLKLLINCILNCIYIVFVVCNVSFNVCVALCTVLIVEECILLRLYTIKYDNHVTSLATIYLRANTTHMLWI
jgi:hypothetical protein